MNNFFKKGLGELDMAADSKSGKNLVWLKDKQKHTNNPYVYLALEKAEKYDVDAVYFRYFQEKRPPVPQIYIFDYTQKPLNEQNIAEKHKRVWNSFQVPLFYVFTQAEILVFNSYNPGFRNDISYNVFEKINIASDIDKELKRDFSARNFDNGSFWENERYRNEFDVKKNAYEKLISKLREIRQNLLKSNDIIKSKSLSKDKRKNIIHKLLVMSILLKYLEEKKDKDGMTVFPSRGDRRRQVGKNRVINYTESFFNDYSKGAKNFLEVLENNGNVIKLFKDLSKHFNGEVFKLNKEEEFHLQKINLNKFVELFEGKTERGGQGTLWRLYSFDDLPVELISNIYEEFIEDKSGGIVYTPPVLVNFLLDEAMPLKDKKTDYKILDPANGSGIFLVQAYKRLIYRWRSTNNWKQPKLKELTKLLLDNIHGVDSEEDAVRLTAFSLTLALCDELSPLVIWNELEFNNLKGKNLFHGDFFELTENSELPTDFALIIGNPPFNIKRTKSFENFLVEQKVPIPDKNPALAFLNCAIKHCDSDGSLCLILPSGPFLYNLGSSDFRVDFIKRYNLEYILDFTHLSRFLFGSGKGDHTTLAVFVKNQLPKGKDLLHITVRRTKTIKQKVWFELDKYDFHYVPYSIALSDKKVDKLVWKSNFLGGGRIHSLMKKLSGFKTLEDYLNKQENWTISEGFTNATQNDLKKLEELLNNSELTEYKSYKNKLTAKFLTGKKYLPTKAFKENVIYEDKIIPALESKYFHSKGKESIYKPPHLLIKEECGRTSVPVSLRNDYITFQRRIIGINAPYNQIKKLKNLHNYLRNNKTILFFIAGYSGEFLIDKSNSFNKRDIVNLPFPENKKELKLSELEEVLIDDTLNYFLEFRRKHGSITKVEEETTPLQLKNFGEYYLQILNSVYKNYKAATPLITESNIIFPFYWGDKSKVPRVSDEKFENHINQLLKNEIPQANLRIIRVMRIYDENVIYLIKPKQLRYWLRSVAIRDADETFAYLVKQEYSL